MATPAVFNHTNYNLVEDDRITRKKDAPPVTMADENELLNEIARYVQAKMLCDFGFEHIMIPDDESTVSTSILATSDWLTTTKLLLVVQNSVVK